MYNPAVARWNGVDALAEKYLGSSPYNYVDNNPLNRIDPNGDDWIITSETNEDGQISLSITFKAALIKSGNSDVNLDKFRDAIVTQIQDAFSNDGEDGIKVTVNAEIKIINDLDEKLEDQHLIELADHNQPDASGSMNHPMVDVWHYNYGQWKNANDASNAYGRTEGGGKHIYINSLIADDIISGKRKNTVPHEVGHTAGLWHPDSDRAPWEQSISGWWPGGIDKLKSNLMTSGPLQEDLGIDQSIQRSATSLQLKILRRNLKESNGVKINNPRLNSRYEQFDNPNYRFGKKP